MEDFELSFSKAVSETPGIRVGSIWCRVGQAGL